METLLLFIVGFFVGFYIIGPCVVAPIMRWFTNQDDHDA